jgi:branched-chain amino acid transport system permease protein
VTLLQVIVNGVLLGGVYALFAAGLNMIVGVMRVINLAHGELMMLGAYTTFWLFSLAHVNPLLSIPISAGLMLVLGVAVQRLLVERVVKQPLLSSLLLTFGLSTLFLGIALNVWKGDQRSIPYLSGSVPVGGLLISNVRLVGFAIAVLLTSATFLFLRHSTFGKTIRATSQQPDAAQACGIDVRRVRAVTFGIGSALAAVAGSLASIMFSFNPEIGQTFLPKAFAVIVLGGLGSFIGALLGALMLGVAETVAGYFTSGQWAESVAFIILIVMLVIRPAGLFGAEE